MKEKIINYKKYIYIFFNAKMLPESAAPSKRSTHHLPAPIFLSGLDNRTRPAPDRHIQNLEKSLNFKTAISKLGK